MLTLDLDFIFLSENLHTGHQLNGLLISQFEQKAPTRRNTGLLIRDILSRRQELLVCHLIRLVSLEAILMGIGRMDWQRDKNTDIIHYHAYSSFQFLFCPPLLMCISTAHLSFTLVSPYICSCFFKFTVV